MMIAQCGITAQKELVRNFPRIDRRTGSPDQPPAIHIDKYRIIEGDIHMVPVIPDLDIIPAVVQVFADDLFAGNAELLQQIPIRHGIAFANRLVPHQNTVSRTGMERTVFVIQRGGIIFTGPDDIIMQPLCDLFRCSFLSCISDRLFDFRIKPDFVLLIFLRRENI